MEVKYVDNAATDDNFQLVGGTLDTYKWYSTRRWKQSAYRKQSKPKGLTYERTNNKFSNSSANLC